MPNATGLRFPLEEDFLPRVAPTPQDIALWKANAQADIDSVLQSRKSWYYHTDNIQNEYSLVYEKHTFRGYTRKVDDSPAAKRDLFCCGPLNVHLDDLAYGLYCETTLQQRSVLAHVYTDTFLDAAVLHVAETQSMGDPFGFAGIKWMAFSSAVPALISPRDYLYFEFCCTATDADGRSVLVQHIQSIDLRPEQMETHDMGFTRSTTYLFNTYRMDHDTRQVWYQSSGRYDPGGPVPTWVASARASLTFESIHNVANLADVRAIVTSRDERSSSSLGKAVKAKACHVCQKKFNLIRVRQSCRACDNAICKNCAVSLHMFNPASQFTQASRVVKERFCTRCVMYARDARSPSNMMHRGALSTGTELARQESNQTTDDEGSPIGVIPAAPRRRRLSSLEPNEALALESLVDVKASTRARRRRSSCDVDADNRIRTQSENTTLMSEDEEGYAPKLTYKAGQLTSLSCSSIESPPPPVVEGADAIYTRIQQARSTPLDRTRFMDISQSLAEQQALLFQLNQERTKFHNRAANPRSMRHAYDADVDVDQFEVVPHDLRASELTVDDDRFEVIV